MRFKTPKLFILLLFLILLTRLSLFNPNGQYFFGDEIFYKRLINTLKQSEKEKNPTLYFQGVFGINAKPGFGILYSIPIWLEVQKPNVPYGTMLNLVFNSLIPIFVYLILQRIVNQSTAILATIVLIFSISSIFYIRHMLPYDASLATLLLALYVFIKRKSALNFGIISAVSFLIYPSNFYYLIPIPFLLFIYNKRFKLKKSVFFVGGFALVVISAQLISMAIGATPSYFDEAQHLSGIVTQGDFIPVLPFLTEYVRSYDGILGLLIIAFAPLIIFLKEKKKFFPWIIYLILIFLILEIFSHIAAKTVLYGRTIRPFYLLLLIYGIIALDSLFRKVCQSRLFYALGFSAFIFIVLVNWWPRFNTFKHLIYPTAFREEAENYLKTKNSKYTLEDIYTKKEVVDDNTTDPPTISGGKFYLVNPTLLYPYYGSLSVPCDTEILIEREHALLFKPYHYEGFTRQMRSYLDQEPPKYQLIYCK
ncbi:glycosyltransferase family 39 protein [Candidatus Microgenomates bacterium]|nr:glycosyltransferase family 39 protein [Candidatus Microgenomates bacterium]